MSAGEERGRSGGRVTRGKVASASFKSFFGHASSPPRQAKRQEKDKKKKNAAKTAIPLVTDRWLRDGKNVAKHQSTGVFGAAHGPWPRDNHRGRFFSRLLFQLCVLFRFKWKPSLRFAAARSQMSRRRRPIGACAACDAACGGRAGDVCVCQGGRRVVVVMDVDGCWEPKGVPCPLQF